jgi:hypothetical protein
MVTKWLAHQGLHACLHGPGVQCFQVLHAVLLFGDLHRAASTLPSVLQIVLQTPALVAAFVHCCYLMQCQPDIDPESLFSTHSIAQVIDDADEFYSAVSSLSENVGDVGQIVGFDEFFECPSPNEPLVGS